jgi:hypothetical protein
MEAILLSARVEVAQDMLRTEKNGHQENRQKMRDMGRTALRENALYPASPSNRTR